MAYELIETIEVGAGGSYLTGSTFSLFGIEA